jgi:glycosyltransferase involved in cell wall biosynthesis
VSRKLRVFWKGAFFSDASLAIVNRRLVGALIDRGNLEIAVGTEPCDSGLLPPAHRRIAGQTAFPAEGADVTVVHEWPPRFTAPAGRRYVHYQPWEYGSMPRTWFDALYGACDDLWCPSSHTRRGYVEAGFPAERVAVIPHGVDPRIFRPDGPKAAIDHSRFRFLFFGSLIFRKGIDVLIEAYGRAFGDRDPVVLTIKDVGTARMYGEWRYLEQLEAFARRPSAPRIEFLDASVPDEAIPQILRAADCLVHPYRGEGFALPVLEAMACGVPAIVTGGGATDDFVDERAGWKLPSVRREIEAAAMGSRATVTPAWVLEPDSGALAELLRSAYEHRDEVRRRGSAAARLARSWTWDRAAAIVEHRLAQIVQSEPGLTRSRPPSEASA